MRLKVFVVVDAQEGLDLAGQEQEELLGSTSSHQFPGDHDLGLGEGEGGIAMEVDRAHAEVGAAEVDGEVEALSTSQDKSRQMIESSDTFSVPFGTSVTKVGI